MMDMDRKLSMAGFIRRVKNALWNGNKSRNIKAKSTRPQSSASIGGLEKVVGMVANVIIGMSSR